MATRLNDLVTKAIDQTNKEIDDLRVDCSKQLHECVMNTIRTGLDRYAKEGKTSASISMSQMNLLNTCNPIAEKVMTDYVKRNQVVDGIKLKPYTFYDYDYELNSKRVYLHGSQTGVSFDWSKPTGNYLHHVTFFQKLRRQSRLPLFQLFKLFGLIHQTCSNFQNSQ